MSNYLKYFSILSISLFALTKTGLAAEQTCVTTLTCEELGYTKKVSDCLDGSVKCPLDINKVFCQGSSGLFYSVSGTSGVSLKITALRDFYGVKRGEKGGTIKYETNLDQTGAWITEGVGVGGEAYVSGQARVEVAEPYASGGGIQISEQARIYGNAKIKVTSNYMYIQGESELYDNATVINTNVYGAKIYGNAYIEGISTASSFLYSNVSVFGDSKLYNVSMTEGGNGQVKIYGNSDLKTVSLQKAAADIYDSSLANLQLVGCGPIKIHSSTIEVPSGSQVVSRVKFNLSSSGSCSSVEREIKNATIKVLGNKSVTFKETVKSITGNITIDTTNTAAALIYFCKESYDSGTYTAGDCY
ncbi:MAG: hypothetical protein PHE89_03495 [Alphaproteobacteria bacterium]|nr:hypothetical protein [Alphaproteobacteria bacterium]